MTFEWEDIAGKVLFAAYRADDMVTAITEDGREYLFEFGELDTLEKQHEILERFLGERMNFNECDNGEDFRENERWFYKWLPFAYIFVRKDFFERFSEEFEKQSVKRYLTAFDTAKKLLDPNGEFPRLIIRQQRRPGKWEALTFSQKRIKEIDEIIKKIERELSENKQELLENSISLEEFKARSYAKLNERKEPEPVILTFEWEDITDEILDKVVYVEFKRSDTLLPGCVNAITEEGREYVAQAFDCDKEDDLRELFLGGNIELDVRYAVTEDTKNFRAMGKWLYKRVYTRRAALQIFVRKDFFERFISVYEERNEDCYSALYTARKLLNPERKQPRMIHSQTLAEWEL